MVTAAAAFPLEARYSGLLDVHTLAARARRTTLLLTDCDGVLTDGGVYYSDAGDVLRRFSVRDGMGVALLKDAGISTAIVTRETSAAVLRRAGKLGSLKVYLGVLDKAVQLPAILGDLAVAPAEVAYIGDDVNDLGIMAAVAEAGLTGAPADAMPGAFTAAHYRCRARGGFGAFREFAEWILDLRQAQPS